MVVPLWRVDDVDDLDVERLCERDGTVIGFERAEVIALADARVTEQAVKLWMFRPVNQTAFHIGQHVWQQIWRIAHYRTILHNRLVQRAGITMAARLRESRGVVARVWFRRLALWKRLRRIKWPSGVWLGWLGWFSGRQGWLGG
jgi:hypothetical protein